MKKLLARFAVAGALALSALFAAGPPASAGEGMTKSGDGILGTSCQGSYYSGFNFPEGSSKSKGAIFVYYSPANGGTYCAFTRNYVRDGKPHYMKIRVDAASNYARDENNYYYYAGTAAVPQAASRCILITGTHETSTKRIHVGNQCDGRSGVWFD